MRPSLHFILTSKVLTFKSLTFTSHLVLYLYPPHLPIQSSELALLLKLLALYMIFKPLPHLQESGDNGVSPSLQQDSTASSHLLQEAATGEMSPLQIIKHRDFWILWFTFVCNNQGICYVSTYWKVSEQIFLILNLLD